VAAWLQIGQALSEEKIARLQNEDTIEVAFQRAYRFLSYRARSEAEVTKRLSEQGFEAPVIDVVLARLRANGFVGDERFAQEWVENRSTFRPRSRRMLALELRQKGVEDEVIQETLEQSGTDETLAYEAAVRYAKRLETLDWEEFRKRLSGFLGRRGFSYGTVSATVRRVWAERQDDSGS
jgi:regulatory protein